MGQVTVYSGVEHRRQRNEQKRSLIEAAIPLDALVAEGARAADVRPSPIHRWRRDRCGAGRAGSGFPPVVVSTGLRYAAPPPPPAMSIEIGGSLVRIAADEPAKLVTAISRSLAR